jgi:hypothetical protein
MINQQYTDLFCYFCKILKLKFLHLLSLTCLNEQRHPSIKSYEERKVDFHVEKVNNESKQLNVKPTGDISRIFKSLTLSL